VTRAGATFALLLVGAAAVAGGISATPSKTRPIPLQPFTARFNVTYSATINYSHTGIWRKTAGYCDTPSNETVHDANFEMHFKGVGVGVRKATPVTVKKTLGSARGIWSNVGEYVLPGGCGQDPPQPFRCTGKIAWDENGAQIATVFLTARGNGQNVTIDIGLPEVQEGGRDECLAEPSDAVGGPIFGLLTLAPLYRTVHVTLTTKLLQAKWQSFAPLQVRLPKGKAKTAGCGQSTAQCTPIFLVNRKLVLTPL
jgi:hypothetical protein